jgi:hypothetical protein
MGMRDAPEVDFDEEIVVLLMAMYQDMGNHIALQYAGSHLVRIPCALGQRDSLFWKRWQCNSYQSADR